MAVMNAQYKHPRDSAYSDGLKNLIDSMLKAPPVDRPDIDQVWKFSCISFCLEKVFLTQMWILV